jgi:alkaline phosphatase D
LIRRAAAYQAFYEHMPVRRIVSRPNGPLMRIYDRFTFGDLIEISVIDGRQYRSREACYAPPNKGGSHLETSAGCPERLAAGRTMMGFGQEAWLYAGLAQI